MKIKKVEIVRPEMNVEFERPILGRLYFITCIARLFSVATMNLQIYDMEYNAVKLKKIYCIGIPKLRFGVGNEYKGSSESNIQRM
ncbi:MAG: hypothetical protein HUJ53_09240 [Holdemanella sp.]|nr:hypothetical protein [Holdemanella sp.]